VVLIHLIIADLSVADSTAGLTMICTLLARWSPGICWAMIGFEPIRLAVTAMSVRNDFLIEQVSSKPFERAARKNMEVR
jgi:hypothetical protein